jgi:F420-dependent oxidoreductase-like protein
MKLSLLFPETRSITAVAELAAATEAQGFHGMWLGSAFGFDPIMALALAGPATSTIQLGVAVVPTWPRHPVVMAQQAATASAATAGRFRLGVGPSHQPVMSMYGIPFDRPVEHTREYLEVLRALLADGHVKHKGDRYQVMAFLDVADAPLPPVLLGVLRPAMAALAGSNAEGALCWLGPAAYLHDVIAPAMAKGAADAGRETPSLIAEFPVALTSSRDEVHAMAARDLAIYTQVPTYGAMWDAAGITRDGNRWTDEMIEVSVLYGDEDTLARKIHALFDAGADEVVLSPFGVGDDTVASQEACIRVLGDLAKG